MVRCPMPWQYRGAWCTCGPSDPNPDCICMKGLTDKIGYLFHRDYIELNRGGSLE